MTRRFTVLLLAASALTVPTFALAQDAKPDALPAWDQLTPAQRELLIAPVRDRWNREPERRQKFMEYAKRWKDMPPPQRDHARRDSADLGSGPQGPRPAFAGVAEEAELSGCA